MIFWIASYPKSGNTWLRILISCYYYTENGLFYENVFKKIGQFPEKMHFTSFEYDKNIVTDTTRLWIKAQEKINDDNKLKFFKTHNAFGKINNFDFTNPSNSLGGIYIVKDPRNVITSIKNHYDLDDDKAIKWITNKNNYIYDVERVKEVGYGDFQFISSWDLNYKSWKVQKKIPVKFIKYEDLTEQTYSVVLDMIKFIYKITNNSNNINKKKLKNALNSTTFDKLQNKEKIQGFSEAVSSFTTNEKITFFNLGPKNDWKKILNEDLKNRINQTFEKNLKELSYV